MTFNDALIKARQTDSRILKHWNEESAKSKEYEQLLETYKGQIDLNNLASILFEAGIIIFMEENRMRV